MVPEQARSVLQADRRGPLDRQMRSEIVEMLSRIFGLAHDRYGSTEALRVLIDRLMVMETEIIGELLTEAEAMATEEIQKAKPTDGAVAEIDRNSEWIKPGVFLRDECGASAR